MKRSRIRHISLTAVVAAAIVCSSCSSLNRFIVVNASRAVLTVSYRVKSPSELAAGAPETLPVSQIDNQVPWQPLPSSRYKIDTGDRLVTLTLNPDEALILTRCQPAHHAGSGDCEPDEFSIAELGLAGSNGEIKLSGEQAHKTFVQNRNTYTLTYY